MAETGWIDELSDAEAVMLLKRFAAGNQRAAEVTELTPAVREALGEAAGVPSGATAGVKSEEGELARLTLQLLATSDPGMAATLAGLHAGPRVEAFGLVLTVGVITAAIIALQTKVKFEAKDGGKWSVKIEKGALNDNLLKDVIAKLFGLAGG